MTILNTKIHIGFAAVACLAAIALAIGGVWNVAKAQPSSVITQASATATSTPLYVGNGTATSTYQFDNPAFSSGKVANTQSVDDVSLYMQAVSSTTATQYTITPQYSNNNIDWYGIGSQGTASAAGAIAVSTTTSFTWTPGATATTSMMFKLPVAPALHERVVLTASGAAGGVYFEVDMKKNPSNP